MISARDIGWLAGLFEGEGYFACRKSQGLTIQITMTDGDVIRRAAETLGFGSIREYALPSGKSAFRWTTGDQPNTAGLMMTLLPLMGARRAQKIRDCLAAWKLRTLPRRNWSECSHGHPLSGGNLLIVTEGKYTKRRCRQCGNDRQRRYRESQ